MDFLPKNIYEIQTRSHYVDNRYITSGKMRVSARNWYIQWYPLTGSAVCNKGSTETYQYLLLEYTAHIHLRVDFPLKLGKLGINVPIHLYSKNRQYLYSLLNIFS